MQLICQTKTFTLNAIKCVIFGSSNYNPYTHQTHFMKTSLLAAFAILMPFAFKVMQVLKDEKKHLKRMNERYKQFLRYKSRKTRAKEKQHIH
jgi:hypothetical protein